MGIRASKDGTIDHARQIEIIRIPRLAGDLGEGFMTGRGFAYNLERTFIFHISVQHFMLFAPCESMA